MKEVIITNKDKYFSENYPFVDPPKMTDKKRCIHCGSIITVGDFKVFKGRGGDELIYCPNAPECDGTVIDWFDLDEELSQDNLKTRNEALANTSSFTSDCASIEAWTSIDHFDLKVDSTQVDFQIDAILNTWNPKEEKVYRIVPNENKRCLVEFDHGRNGWIPIKQSKRVSLTMKTFEFLVIDFFSDYFDEISFYKTPANSKMIGVRNNKEFYREFDEISTWHKKKAYLVVHFFGFIKDEFISQDLGRLYKSTKRKSPKNS